MTGAGERLNSSQAYRTMTTPSTAAGDDVRFYGSIFDAMEACKARECREFDMWLPVYLEQSVIFKRYLVVRILSTDTLGTFAGGGCFWTG